jgi:Carboxypeptidase regulatory-like domain/TonB dependent receptor/TonB-dependent Receptor Plug Domain
VRRPTDAVLLLLILFCSVGLAMAQSTNATVSGIVLDPSGRGIAGADIEIVNDATGIRYPGATNGEGIYAVPNLPPGPYRIQISKIGFMTIIKPDIILNTQDALAINFTLPVGAASETVTVEGGAPLLQTESPAVSTVIDRQFVENLPLNGRSFNTLLQLTPGAVIAHQAQGGSGSSPGQFSISGQRTDANTFTVDGVSANFGVSTTGLYSGESGTGSGQAFSALGGTSSLVSVEALQEFRIETSSFAPEFGRTPGGQVMLTTRSGTNDYHGGVYDYFRNDAMDANDWFANHVENPRAPERHNDFGGYLGGPVFKTRTFFFASYEGARLRLPQTTVTQVPYLDGSACTASPSIAPFLNAYPGPNGTVSTTSCTGAFTGSYSNTATLDATSVRIDHNLSSKFSIFGRYNYAPSQTVSRAYSLSMLEASPVNTQTLTAGLNMLLKSDLANTLRGNYSSQTSSTVNSLDAFRGSTPLPANVILGSLAAQNSNASFETFDTDYYDFGPVARNRTRQMNFVDDLSVGRGAHQLKFGGDYRAIFLDKVPYANSVLVLATSVKDLLTTGSGEMLTSTRRPTDLLTQSLSIYGQDTWKANSRLTFTYGVRWEIAPAPSARGKTILASWKNVSNPATLAIAPFGTPLWAATYTNFAPRLGFAFLPSKKENVVVRVGLGVFYDLGVGSVADVGSFFPGEATLFTPSISIPVADINPYLPTISVDPPYPLVEAFSPSLRLPRSYQWNVAVEKTLGAHQVISGTYVGQRGGELLRRESTYQPNSNFQSDFLLTVNSARSNYHAFEAQYRRPLSNHLQALVNYTWSHSLDNASDDVVAGLGNTVISAQGDYGSSGFDVRHSFSGAITLSSPTITGSPRIASIVRDWSLAAVVVARTGFPFNGVVQLASPDPGGYALSRPDRVPGQPSWTHDSLAGGSKSLNPDAFVVPSTARQGSESRNDIPGLGLAQADLSLGRKFGLTDHLKLLFRADAFNAFNHPNFTNPPAYVEFGPAFLVSQQMLNAGLGGLNPLFQEGGPRSLQLSLKLTF